MPSCSNTSSRRTYSRFSTPQYGKLTTAATIDFLLLYIKAEKQLSDNQFHQTIGQLRTYLVNPPPSQGRCATYCQSPTVSFLYLSFISIAATTVTAFAVIYSMGITSLFRFFPRLGHSWNPLTFSSSNFIRIPAAQKIEEETIPAYVASRYYPVRLGEVFQHRYQIVGKLGYGTSSTVWLARDLWSVAENIPVKKPLSNNVHPVAADMSH